MVEKTSSSVVGTQQSPIDIQQQFTLYAPELQGQLQIGYLDKVACGTVSVDEKNFNIDEGQDLTLKFRGEVYDLKKIHFHEECEHEIDGEKPANLEVHLLHLLRGSTDKLALALFLNLSSKAKSRPSLARWNKMYGGYSRGNKDASSKRGAAACTADKLTIEMSEWLKKTPERWYHYQGSLTSEPFSEDVAWVIDSTAGSVKGSEVDALSAAKQHVREVFSLNRRFVLRNYEFGVKAKRNKASATR